MREGLIGYIDSWDQPNRRIPEATWCADNAAFADKWNEKGWWGHLVKNADDLSRCVFAALPDVVGDWDRSLERSAPWFSRVRELGYPTAMVLQDGYREGTFPWDEVDALFVGGSTEFKLGPAAAEAVAEAKMRGKHVHMGRVNTRKRLRYAASIGCDTADGTLLIYGPDFHLEKMLRWVREIHLGEVL